MHYLIDGSNCLGRLPGFSVSDPDSEARFLSRLSAYAAAHRAHEFTVFFDGYGKIRSAGAALTVRRSSKGQTADDLIVGSLRRVPSSVAARCTVITDDRELGHRCRRAGGRVSGTRGFWDMVSRSTAKAGRKLAQPQPSPGSVEDGGLSPAEVKEWEDYFSRPPER